MSDSRISVVIPAFNANRTLPRALASIARQTHLPWEVLLVDDGGAEDVTRVTAQFDLPITVLRKQNGGAASARNLAIDHATGAWVAFLDADDYWEPTKLERQVAIVRQHPQVGFVASAYFEQSPDGERQPHVNRLRFKADCPQRVRGAVLLDFVRAAWTSSVLVARNLLLSNRFAEHLVTAEDRDLWLRLLARTEGYYISQPLATAVLEEGSLSRGNPDGDYPNMLDVISRSGAVLGPYTRWRWRQTVMRAWAACHLQEGDGRRAMRPAASRILREPWSPEAWWVLAKAFWLTQDRRRNPPT